MSPAPAATVPGYELLGPIAFGGMVEVHRARDLATGREVAVKMPRPGLTDPEANRLFLEGVRLLASLPHPGIPPVHALGQLDDGRPFAVMGLVRGATLAERLAGRPAQLSDLNRFVRTFLGVCDAVGFAHARGVVHRNIKSRNVMVGESGDAQIIGWGLATNPGAVTQEELRRYSPLAGVFGTPAYVPPEQARGRPADERSDVFGLGGVLCEILTGDPPFRPGESILDSVRAAAAGDLSDAFARLDACGADPHLVELCKRCLAPDPADRPADGSEVSVLCRNPL